MGNRYLVFMGLLVSLLTVGCKTHRPQSLANFTPSFPSEALITQRAVLKIRGREIPLNGYVAVSESRGVRLVVSGAFGETLADVLVNPEREVFVMDSSPMIRERWIRRYVAGDLLCLFDPQPTTDCWITLVGQDHYRIDRRWYSLDIRTVAVLPERQSDEVFDETLAPAP